MGGGGKVTLDPPKTQNKRVIVANRAVGLALLELISHGDWNPLSLGSH